ncbi:MAG: hypothetical protein EON58_16985 [Alphaproteobacteria bacterium]|nr:MAG: hypothetical protein EON58_16985 [Alphaproteobacteria bacterium]
MANEERRILAARRIWEGRRRSSDFFPEEMFSDAPMSMLLATYIMQSGQQRLTASSLFEYCRLNPSIGQRWLNYLGQQGLVVCNIIIDGPIELSSVAIDRLRRYLDEVVELSEGRIQV